MLPNSTCFEKDAKSGWYSTVLQVVRLVVINDFTGDGEDLILSALLKTSMNYFASIRTYPAEQTKSLQPLGLEAAGKSLGGAGFIFDGIYRRV